jgi:NHL repeat
MIVHQMKSRLPLAATVAALALSPAAIAATEAPVKEIISAHFGREVNLTKVEERKAQEKAGGPVTVTHEEEDVCTVASGNTCQPGSVSGQPGDFHYPEGVAGAPGGNVYVADRANHRVQELEADGKFVLMFGRKVNRGGGDLCTAAEAGECQAGESSSEPGVFGENAAMAVDPVSGDVYVGEQSIGRNGGGIPIFGYRVQKFTAGGSFVLEIGQEVNETTKGNLCTQDEVAKAGVKCKGPKMVERAAELADERGAFGSMVGVGVGGPESRLYVAERQRVQEFSAEGAPVSEPAEAITARLLAISSKPEDQITTFAVDDSCSLHKPVLTESTTPTCKEFDPSYGAVYLVYSAPNVVRRFDASGREQALPLSARVEGTTLFITHLAVDPAGRLGVIESEALKNRGVLYEVGVAGLHPITGFTVPDYTSAYPYSPNEMGFNGGDDLFVTSGQPGHEVTAYVPRSVGEPLAGAASCVEGQAHESDVTFDCILNGEVDPWGVSETEVWFEWGRTTSLGERTTPEAVPNEQLTEGVKEVPNPPCSAHPGEHKTKGEAKCPEAEIKGLVPNEASNYYYQLAGHDHWVTGSEELSSPPPLAKFKTPTVPPRIVGEPVASFQTNSSAVLFGELNPENANTRYEFQYVASEDYAKSEACKHFEASCPSVAETDSQESATYGKVATTLEASGLQPATEYRYRLYATNEKGEAAHNEQGGLPLPVSNFKTAPAPVPVAMTGAYGAVGATSATISGTVNPNGQPATYAFELGVYNGASTQYGIVLSAPAGAGTVPVVETLALTGLQPGTTYAYRIKISSSYGTAYGATETFATTGLPSAPVAPARLAQLPVPPISFPVEPKAPKPLTNAQKLAKALKACAKKPKRKRAACRRAAHTKYRARKSGVHGRGAHASR